MPFPVVAPPAPVASSSNLTQQTFAQQPPAISMPADLAPGGTVLYCKNGLQDIHGHYDRNPLRVNITIICKGDKVVHSLVIH